MEMATLSTLFKAIGDPVRLRLMHLLCAEELAVGELARILGLPQSTISRHLKALRERGLVADRPLGAATFARAVLEAEGGNGDGPVRDALIGLLRSTPLPPADRARLLGMRIEFGSACANGNARLPTLLRRHPCNERSCFSRAARSCLIVENTGQDLFHSALP